MSFTFHPGDSVKLSARYLNSSMANNGRPPASPREGWKGEVISVLPLNRIRVKWQQSKNLISYHARYLEVEE